jgi:glutaryl-CoA dehydrogenase (non-decarboxylating)
LQTRAAQEGDEYVLTGRKTWISLADTADHLLVIARLDQEKRGTKNMGAFIVDRTLPGVSTTTIKHKLGIRAANTGEIALNEVRVPSENRLGEEGEGFKIAMSALDNGRFTVAAGAVGLIRACIQSSIQYAATRKAYNQEIGRFQLIQEHLAEMQASYDASQLLVYKAAWLKNRGERNSRETSMAKWFATTRALDAANRAIQIHGAYGYSADYPVERYWRNARGAVIYEGTNEIQKLIQGAYIMGYRQDRPLRCELPPYPHSDTI